MIRLILSRVTPGQDAPATATFVGREPRIIGATLSLDGKRVASKWLIPGNEHWIDELGALWTHVDFEVVL